MEGKIFKNIKTVIIDTDFACLRHVANPPTEKF